MLKLKLAVLSLAMALPALASAQGAPYSPKAADYSSLLKPASYKESPLQLPYPLIEARQVVNGPRLDFEHVYDVPYMQLIDELEKAFKGQEPLTMLRPGAIPYLNNAELYVMGISQTPSGDRRIVLGMKDVALRFSFDVISDSGRSIVVIQNAIYSQLYSGVMPARAGYKPADAQSVPFRWN